MLLRKYFLLFFFASLELWTNAVNHVPIISKGTSNLLGGMGVAGTNRTRETQL